MVLETGIKVYDNLLKRCVKYVNSGWHTNYQLKYIAGIELDDTFMFVHFNKEDYTKDAYPIAISLIFKY
jgi:hypothetical protein